MGEGQRKILVLAAVFLGGLIAGVAVVIFLQVKQAIGLPPLADVEVELTIERGKLDGEIERIKTLAAKFGGTAIQGAGDDTGTDILAEISPKLKDQFLEALKHPEKEPVVALPEGGNENALVQVRLNFQS
jgi:hypothetical protein